MQIFFFHVLFIVYDTIFIHKQKRYRRSAYYFTSLIQVYHQIVYQACWLHQVHQVQSSLRKSDWIFGELLQVLETTFIKLADKRH